MVSEIFDPSRWASVPGFDSTVLEDLTYHRAVDQGTVRIAFNRPDCRNAFRPRTVDELCVRGQSCANGQTAYSDQPVTIAIWAEAADNSVTITENAQVGAHWDERAENTEVPFELSAREPTAAAVMWQPEPSAAVGDKLTTPDLAHLVQEVVQRP